MKVLSVGMMVCDILISPVPKNILSRDSVNIKPPKLTCGGDALNVAIGLSRLGEKVSIVGKVGADTNGDFVKRYSFNQGVNIENVVTVEEIATPTSFVLIDENAERHFLTNKDMFREMTGDEIGDSVLEQHDLIYFGSVMSLPKMDEGGLLKLFRKAHKYGKVTIMDAAMDDTRLNADWNEILNEVFYETDYFFPSMQEAKAITKTDNLQEIAAYFKKFGMKGFGVKLGEKGCFATDFNSEILIPAVHDIEVIDTTGAGDSFMAALICSIAKKNNFYDAAGFANYIASLNVQKIGGTAGIPTYAEGLNAYKKYSKEL